MSRLAKISRRDALAVLAGAIAASRVGAAAFAQAPIRFDRLAPELDAIVSASEAIVELAAGFGNENGNAEGPLWWKEGRYLLFSDIGNNRRIKYSAAQGASVFAEPTNRANGLTRDMQGRLVAAEQEARRVARYELDGRATVIADRYHGKRLNRPNDVVVKSDGATYFTDPFNREPPEGWEQPIGGVYRVSPDLRAVALVADKIVTPNGLAFSPDETILYISDSRRREIRAFDVRADGLLDAGTQRVFADLSEAAPGNPDGMKVDSEGNVYCGGSGGIHIISPAGKKLGHIDLPTTNVGFGGDDWKTLYFTTRTTLGSLRVKIPGLPVPAVRKP